MTSEERAAMCHVVTSEKEPPCCDIRERESRHVVTSEKEPPRCDVRDGFHLCRTIYLSDLSKFLAGGGS